MHRYVLVALCATSVVNASKAAVFITSTSEPTPNVEGFTTWQLTAHTDKGEIVAFEFVGTGDQFGFFGPLNQVNPADFPTVFEDNNFLFPYIGADVRQDSQFLFNTSDVLTLSSSEGPDHLRALILASPSWTSFGTDVPFVQLVMPENTRMEYAGRVYVRSDDIVQGFSVGTTIPESASLLLSTIAWAIVLWG